jgi:hypothetical protein
MDETTLRLRVDADTTEVSASLGRARDEFGRFVKVAKEGEDQLKQTGAAADDAGRKIAGASDSASIGFGKLSLAMTGAQVAGNALFEALDAVARGFAAPIAEILDAEQAAAMLQGTFGGLTAEMEAVSALASQLGAVNAFFDDDALSQAAATLKLFGANGEAIKELLPYVENLAVAFGVDVNDAAQLVGQALNGQTRALARMVPEVRGANSQLEVLAALQASAARNATIADQRTAGLGGQLALLKRQAADAAQAFGTIMLPAISGVLKAINDYALPVLGKLVGAVAAVGAALGALSEVRIGGYRNLSDEFADVVRITKEAFSSTDALFKRIQVGAAPSASPALAAGGLRPVDFGGTNRTAGAAAGAALRAVRGAEALGPEVPLSMRLETYTEDPGAARAREERLRKEEERRQKAHEDELRSLEEYRQRLDKVRREEFEAKRRAQDELNRFYLDSAIAIGTSISQVLKKAFTGAKVTADEVRGLVGDVAVLTAGIVGGAIGGRETGDVAARIARPLTDVLLPVLEVMGKGLLGIDAWTEKANETSLKITNDTIKAGEMQIEAALIQAEAAKKQQEAAIGAVIGSQDRRRAAAKGSTSLAAYDIVGALVTIPGGGYEELIGQTIRGASDEQLAKLGQLAKTALGTGVEAINAGTEIAKILTGGRAQNLLDFGFGNNYEVTELLLQLVERFGAGTGTAGLAPGEIAQGTTPDRPVYVFDVRPRDDFGFAPQSFFFRNRGAGTSRAVAGGEPLPAAQAAPVTPRLAPVTGGARGRAAG